MRPGNRWAAPVWAKRRRALLTAVVALLGVAAVLHSSDAVSSQDPATLRPDEGTALLRQYLSHKERQAKEVGRKAFNVSIENPRCGLSN
jgi:hypothetical protein